VVSASPGLALGLLRLCLDPPGSGPGPQRQTRDSFYAGRGRDKTAKTGEQMSTEFEEVKCIVAELDEPEPHNVYELRNGDIILMFNANRSVTVQKKDISKEYVRQKLLEVYTSLEDLVKQQIERLNGQEN
jgi:hypothetical protein